MPLTAGQTFAGYTIIRLLGSGGMGEVYLAQHPRLPRRDALKILRPDVSADDDYRHRFIREADLAATLWHPNIVAVHDRSEEDGQLWIAMDYVDGVDLARLLADRYPAGMPVGDVSRIVTAVGSALDYAHKQGLLHRDVKPANIMMTNLDGAGEQRILLMDFGIARSIDDISGLTATNMTVGTMAYCAPEQLLGDDIDGRADEYSLAATAYHLLTGSQLFPNSNPAVVISRQLNAPPPTLAATRPELAVLDPVMAVALAKAPSDRFFRCTDFATAFTEVSYSGGQVSGWAATIHAPVAAKPAQALTPITPQTTPASPQPRPPAPQPIASPPGRITDQNVARIPEKMHTTKSRRRAIIAAALVTLIGLVGIGLGYMIIRNYYYVGIDKSDPDCHSPQYTDCDVTIMRGRPGSILGVRLQQLYFIGCVNDRGELSLIHRRDEVFVRASFDMQENELHCKRMKLHDLDTSVRARVINGLPRGSLDDANRQLRELARDALRPSSPEPIALPNTSPPSAEPSRSVAATPSSKPPHSSTAATSPLGNPSAAFCADNEAQLNRTSLEMGLDPATWASDPRNLARFGLSGAGEIDTLYHMVIDKGPPYVRSYFSNETGAIEWRCSSQ